MATTFEPEVRQYTKMEELEILELEELFRSKAGCESDHQMNVGGAPHTDGHPCTGEASWRTVRECVDIPRMRVRRGMNTSIVRIVGRGLNVCAVI